MFAFVKIESDGCLEISSGSQQDRLKTNGITHQLIFVEVKRDLGIA